MSAKAENEDASPRAILGRVHSLSTPISSLPLSIIFSLDFISDSLKKNVFIITTLIHSAAHAGDESASRRVRPAAHFASRRLVAALRFLESDASTYYVESI